MRPHIDHDVVLLVRELNVGTVDEPRTMQRLWGVEVDGKELVLCSDHEVEVTSGVGNIGHVVTIPLLAAFLSTRVVDP